MANPPTIDPCATAWSRVAALLRVDRLTDLLRNRGRRWSFRGHLMALAAACAIPLLALSVYAVGRIASMERDIARNNQLAATRAIVTVIDLKLTDMLADLQALSPSLSTDPRDLEQIYARAKFIADPGNGSILLARSDGKLLFDTAQALRAPLPAYEDMAGLGEAVAAQKATVSNLFFDGPNKDPWLAIYLPVVTAARSQFVLTYKLPPSIFRDILDQENFPKQWQPGISDRQGTIIARPGPAFKTFVGRKIPADAPTLPLDQMEAFYPISMAGGSKVYLATERSAMAGWKVVIGIPQEVADAPLNEALRTIFVVGLLVLALGLAAAFVIGRRMARSMAALTSAAGRLVDLAPVPDIESSVRELAETGEALQAAGNQLIDNDRQLRRAKAHLARAQAIASIGSLEHDFKTGQSFWSAETYAILGQKPEDLSPSIENFIACVRDGDRGKLRNRIAELRKAGMPIGLDIEIVRRDGEIRSVHMESQLIRDDSDAVADHVSTPQAIATGIVGTVQDVTQRVQVEVELRAAKQTADAANLAKSDFLSRMSHEIRTPMNAVMGLNRLLLESPLNNDQRRYAELANESAAALLSLIDDILDISKLEAGKVEPENIPFNPAMVVDNVVSMLTPRAREKGITLQATMPSAAQRWFRGDPTRLRQVLINLVSNALKFTDEGNVTIEASVPKETAGIARLRFEIVDTGIGISEEAQASLFQAFTQADGSITRRFGGSGLGLSISKQLVELWGGTIGCTSTVGAGSRFWFEISLPAAETPAAEPESPLTPSNDPRAKRQLNLLLVEDNPVNQRVARLVLASTGHLVDVVDNGLSAIEAVRTKRYDVVLMDVQMPGLDGMETTKRIRALPPPASKTPIIAVTANAMSGAREEYLAAGMDDYISKPFQPAELRAQVERLAAADAARRNIEIVDCAAPSQTSMPPIFDPARLDELKEMTDKAKFADMVGEFAQGLEARIARLSDLVAQANWSEAAREAHDIGGISGTVGAARLSSLARELEAICKTGKPAECQTVFSPFAGEASKALRALKTYQAAA